MTDRERILTTIRGDVPDRLPFLPRLEFWHRAGVRKGTLPPEFCDLSLIEIADQLGAGYYQIIPDFTRRSHPLDMIDYGIGVFRVPSLLYEPRLGGDVERRIIRQGLETAVEYRTPAGSIRTAFVFTNEMLDAGASVPWITEHAIQQPQDIDVVGYIWSHLEVVSRIERYLQQKAEVADRGIVVGWVSGSACPIHHIMRELMSVEQFFYALHDYPAKVYGLAEKMEPYYQRIKQVGAASEAEIIYLGGNYEDTITSPPFFREHILPALRDYSTELHQKGKYLLTHTDGENRLLIPLYLEAGFDIADSVCPYPMTRLTLDDLLDAFAGRITLCGGIPSVLLCRDSGSGEDFRSFIDRTVHRHRRHPRLILGVSDMVPADAEYERLRYIADAVRLLE